MKKIRFYTALIAARLVYLAIKILNKSSGTSFVGMFTLKICPDFLKYCKKYIKNSIITVTGTNEKNRCENIIKNKALAEFILWAAKLPYKKNHFGIRDNFYDKEIIKL